MDYITEQLREHIELPDRRELHLIEHVDIDIMLFSGHLIRRTAPLAQQLQLLTLPVCIMKKRKSFLSSTGHAPTQQLVCRFLCGETDGNFYNEETLQLKESFIYPTVSEA